MNNSTRVNFNDIGFPEEFAAQARPLFDRIEKATTIKDSSLPFGTVGVDHAGETIAKLLTIPESSGRLVPGFVNEISRDREIATSLAKQLVLKNPETKMSLTNILAEDTEFRSAYMKRAKLSEPTVTVKPEQEQLLQQISKATREMAESLGAKLLAA